METRKPRPTNRKLKKRTRSFTEALKDKYCVEEEPTFDFIIVSPKRKNAAGAELAHLRTVVLNDMDVNRADIPRAGLVSLCPNVVDLDLANNMFDSWSELLTILASLPKVKYVNVSRNKFALDEHEIPESKLTVENLALNDTGFSIQDAVKLSKVMPHLKELHLCGNEYTDLGDLEDNISSGAFSALECLRLNNNGLTSWSEIWKLRHLPQLKYLILSGNPILDIFYKTHDNSAKPSETDDVNNLDIDAKPSVTFSLGDECEACDVDAITLDIGDDDDGIGKAASLNFQAGHDDNDKTDAELMNEMNQIYRNDNDDCDYDCNICGIDDDDEDDEYDMYDSSLDGRPVSRFGFHHDVDVVSSEESSDVELEETAPSSLSMAKTTISTASNTDGVMVSSETGCSQTEAKPSSSGINIPKTCTSAKNGKNNINTNNSRNSRSVTVNFSSFDDGSALSNEDNLLLPAAMLGLDGDLVDEDEDPRDLPRLAAEQFLYDLIDQLDLDDTSSTAVTTTAASLSTVQTTTMSSSSSITTHTSSSWCSASNSITASSHSELLTSSRTRIEGVPTYQHSAVLSATDTTISSLFPTSSSDNAASISNPQSLLVRDRNQNAAFGTEQEEDKDKSSYSNSDFMSRMLSALDDEDAGSDTEEGLFAQSYSDDDFVPRAVNLLNDDVHDSYFSPPAFAKQQFDTFNLAKLTTQSAAKRRLFDVESSSASNIAENADKKNQNGCVFSISNRPSTRFNPSFEVNPSRFEEYESQDTQRVVERNITLSESDSCSDCEAEQHAVTAQLRRELNDLALQAASTAEARHHTQGTSSSSSDSVYGRTSDGNLFSTTYMKGGRVVVTGFDDDECFTQATHTSTLPSCTCSSTEDTSTQICQICTNHERLNSKAADNHEKVKMQGEDHSNAEHLCHTSSNDLSVQGEGCSLPFHKLEMLCLSSAGLSHWEHLVACTDFPALNNVRLKNNPLYSSVNSDDRRKLYIASLPKVTIFNGSEITTTERVKAENFYLRYYMNEPDKPKPYSSLVAKHGPPVELVEIDLRANYQEFATLTFKCEGMEDFTRMLDLKEPVARLRSLVSKVLQLPKWSFLLHHHPCGPSHPESEREVVELRCEAMPMSRFDFAEGDEILVELPNRGQ